jgi:hypothetical protein
MAIKLQTPQGAAVLWRGSWSCPENHDLQGLLNAHFAGMTTLEEAEQVAGALGGVVSVMGRSADESPQPEPGGVVHHEVPPEIAAALEAEPEHAAAPADPAPVDPAPAPEPAAPEPQAPAEAAPAAVEAPKLEGAIAVALPDVEPGHSQEELNAIALDRFTAAAQTAADEIRADGAEAHPAAPAEAHEPEPEHQDGDEPPTY